MRENLFDTLNDVFQVRLTERRVDQERHARLAEVAGNRQAVGRAEIGAVERALEIDLGARAMHDRHAKSR